MKKFHLILTLVACLLMAMPFAALADDNDASAQTSWLTLVDKDSLDKSIQPGDTVDATFEINDTSERTTDAALSGVYIWATDASGNVTDALDVRSSDISLTDGSIAYTYYADEVVDGDTITVSFARKGVYVLHAGIATSDNPSNVSKLTQLQIDEKTPSNDSTDNNDASDDSDTDDNIDIAPTPDNTDSTNVDMVQMVIGAKRMYVNHKRIDLDVAPYIHYDYTYVPIRALTEAFGADVSWDGDSRQVRIETEDKTIIMTIGDTKAIVQDGTSDTEYTLVSAPEITNNRTFVAIRDVAELLDYDITAVLNDDGTVNYVRIER